MHIQGNLIIGHMKTFLVYTVIYYFIDTIQGPENSKSSFHYLTVFLRLIVN